MLAPSKRRLFALACTLALGLTLAIFSYGALASAAQVTIYTPQGSALCARTNTQAPAVYQTQVFLVAFDYFRVLEGPAGPEQVAVDITFPDGRIFTYSASRALDGVIDMPANSPVGSLFASNGAGQLSLNVQVPGSWPYGCYTITGRGLSVPNVHTGRANFVVVPGGQPGPSGGPASLRVTRNGVDLAEATQGSIVEVDGRNFIGGELVSLWLTAPDGTVLNFPPGQQVVEATPAGAFSTSFQFEGKNPVGQYIFTALGQTSGARVFASFTLRSPAVTPSGPAQLQVVVPTDRGGPQRTVFYANGSLFWPGERVDIWLTLPDGAVRGFPSTFADEIAGQFSVELGLDERLPVGFYQLTAQGANSRQLVIATFNLEQASGTVLDPGVSPEVGYDGPPTPPDVPFNNPNPAIPSEYGNPDE